MRLSVFAVSAALALCAAGDGVRIATRDWVKSALAAQGVRISTAAAVTNGTKVAYSSAYSDTNLPGCVSVSFTFSAAKVSTAAKSTRAAARGVNPGAGGITTTLHGGSWTDSRNKVHSFTLPEDGIALEFGERLPELPAAEHECSEYGSDCVCVGYGLDPESVEIPHDYDAAAVFDEASMANMLNWENWIDKAAWPYVRQDRNGNDIYGIVDEDGLWTTLDNVSTSDAWIDAILAAITEGKRHLNECAAAYRLSFVCDGDGRPVHEWAERSCGGNSWRECTRNRAHLDGTRAHSFPGASDALLHRCVCGDTSESHSFGAWVEAARDEGSITMARSCSVCGWIDTKVITADGLESCNTNLDLHVAAAEVCGCRCGKYGKGAMTAERKDFHKWTGTDANGVTNCLCECEARHEFREPSTYWKNSHADEWCDGVCIYCLKRNRAGNTAGEDDHAPKPRSKHECGCKCGRYGVTSEHANAGLTAVTERLHIRSFGDLGLLHCRCFGTGDGGQWHWHSHQSTCTRICGMSEITEGMPFGHIVSKNEDGAEHGITAARVDDHTGPTYGCGCKCGILGTSNRAEWRHVTKFHRPKQNADDRCHCSCEYRNLVGTGEGGHEFAEGACICTCGEYRKAAATLNACGVCALCGDIHRKENGLWATWDGSNINEHRFSSDSCKCRCGAYEIPHDVEKGEAVQSATYYCSDCGSELTKWLHDMKCKRCGTVVRQEWYKYNDCGCGGNGEADARPETCRYCDIALTDSTALEDHLPTCPLRLKADGGAEGSSTGGDGGIGGIRQ